MPDTRSAQQHLEQSQAVIDRLLALPGGGLHNRQLWAAQTEYQACKPPEGLQAALRQKAASAILGMFGKR